MRRLILFVLFCLPALGAIALVQAPAAVLCSNAANCAITFSSNVTSGNLIVFSAAVSYGTTFPDTTLADSLSTSYTKVYRTRHGTQTDHYLETWWGCASSTGANTVTISAGTMTYVRVTAIEYSGIACPTPVDRTAAASGTSANVATGTVTTTQADELLYVGASKYNAAPTWTAGANFTIRADSNIPTAARDGVMAEDRIVSNTGDYSGTATLSTSSNWNVHIVTFRASGGAPAGVRKRVVVVTR